MIDFNPRPSPIIHGNADIAPERDDLHDAELLLTAFELKALNRLAEARKVVSTFDLHAALYGNAGSAGESNVLQVILSRLRKKLDAAGANVAILTVRGRGYELVAAEKPNVVAVNA